MKLQLPSHPLHRCHCPAWSTLQCISATTPWQECGFSNRSSTQCSASTPLTAHPDATAHARALAGTQQSTPSAQAQVSQPRLPCQASSAGCSCCGRGKPSPGASTGCHVRAVPCSSSPAEQLQLLSLHSPGTIYGHQRAVLGESNPKQACSCPPGPIHSPPRQSAPAHFNCLTEGAPVPTALTSGLFTPVSPALSLWTPLMVGTEQRLFLRCPSPGSEPRSFWKLQLNIHRKLPTACSSCEGSPVPMSSPCSSPSPRLKVPGALGSSSLAPQMPACCSCPSCPPWPPAGCSSPAGISPHLPWFEWSQAPLRRAQGQSLPSGIQQASGSPGPHRPLPQVGSSFAPCSCCRHQRHQMLPKGLSVCHQPLPSGLASYPAPCQPVPTHSPLLFSLHRVPRGT